MSFRLSSIPDTPYRQSAVYKLISIGLFTVIFYQPYSIRLSLWQCVIDTAAKWSSERATQKVYIVLFGGLIIHTLVFVVLNVLMGVIYAINHPYLERFKIQQNREWPWRDSSEKVRRQYWSLVKKSIFTLMINNYVVSPILFLSGWKRAESLISVSIHDVPHWYTTMWQVAVFMVIEDTLFYWAHRALHHPAIYGYIHKKHHEFKQPIGIASEYAHPIEFIFSNAIPFSMGPQLLHAHCFTFFVWYVWRIGETVDGHSGYEFPFVPYRLLPFSGSATFHDYHHSRNVGNYSSFFTYWDRIMQTNSTYPQYISKMEQSFIEVGKKINAVCGDTDALKPSGTDADVLVIDNK